MSGYLDSAYDSQFVVIPEPTKRKPLYGAALAALAVGCVALLLSQGYLASLVEARPQLAASPPDAQETSREAADDAAADIAKYREIALNLMARHRRGTVGADECSRAVHEASAMPLEEHRRYAHTYWKAAADVCQVYLDH